MPASDAGPSLGGRDLFVSRIHPTTGIVERNMVRSGRLNEEATSIVTGEDAGTNTTLYVTGYTESPDFPMGVPPVTGNTQTDGGREALVLKLNDQLGTPVWGTFIGAASGPDEGRGVLYVPERNSVMVVGTTRSGGDFPHSYPPTQAVPAGANAFLAAFDPSTGTRTTSSIVGGVGDDEGNALAPGPVLTNGSVQTLFIGGKTTSTDLPISFGFDSQSAGTEGFVIQMGYDGTGFVPEWGTYVGGSQTDEVRTLASRRTPTNTLFIGGTTRSPEMLPNPLRPLDFGHAGGEDMFLISLASSDLTPPLGEVRDGISGDRGTDTNPRAFLANWTFTDRETPILDYHFGAGTIPGCANVLPFRSVGLNVSVSLNSTQGQMPELEPGKWYFATVIARNQAGMQNRVSSNGYFLLLPDGGPNPLPPRPMPVSPCPGEEPDGGTPDAGVDGGTGTDGGTDGGADGGDGESDGGSGPESPVGWSCGCGTGGGPTSLVLLVLVALGLRTIRREA
jgi:MYXO-CTERM domain-containing protein